MGIQLGPKKKEAMVTMATCAKTEKGASAEENSGEKDCKREAENQRPEKASGSTTSRDSEREFSF